MRSQSVAGTDRQRILVHHWARAKGRLIKPFEALATGYFCRIKLSPTGVHDFVGKRNGWVRWVLITPGLLCFPLPSPFVWFDKEFSTPPSPSLRYSFAMSLNLPSLVQYHENEEATPVQMPPPLQLETTSLRLPQRDRP